MNYKQAVEAALQGNADAFSALYESTQNNMYYLALKYMKNPDDAKDVLQDAYIKAWQSLPTLKDPEHFPAWLGRIVANTAKNMLVKKKPDLFSDLEKENEDGDAPDAEAVIHQVPDIEEADSGNFNAPIDEER